MIVKSKTQTPKTTTLPCCHCLSVCPYYLSGRPQASIYIVQPVNKVEESKSDRKNDPWPLVNGADVCQVWDFELQLGRAPAQAAVGAVAGGGVVAQRHVAVQAGVVAKAIPRGQRLAELDSWAFEGHDRVSRVAHAAHHVRGQQLVVHLQRAQEDVAVRVDLEWGTQTQRYWGVLCTEQISGWKYSWKLHNVIIDKRFVSIVKVLGFVKTRVLRSEVKHEQLIEENIWLNHAVLNPLPWILYFLNNLYLLPVRKIRLSNGPIDFVKSDFMPLFYQWLPIYEDQNFLIFAGFIFLCMDFQSAMVVAH